MSRRKRTDKVSKTSSGARPKRVRRQRVKRDQSTPDASDFSWLSRIKAKLAAEKILRGYPERPYWLSIPHGSDDGAEPVSGLYPCSYFRTRDRVYYGFLFRQHREQMIEQWDRARRHLLEDIQRIKSRNAR